MNTGALARAFSLRRGVRALFFPAEATRRLRPLDGLRALSVLWVVVFHAGWYSWRYLPPASYAALLGAHWMLPIWRGDFGVDVFFVLSGFLIAGILIDERKERGAIDMPRFYVRRLMRLWPALVVALVVDILVFDDHPTMAWANLLYVSNFVPVANVCMGWGWSLSIEEQFYLVCPWLLHALGASSYRTRLLVLGAVGLASIGAAAYAVAAGPFFSFDAEIVVTRHPERWSAAFDRLYTKPWMRAGPLLAGVAAAYTYRAPGVMDRSARAKIGAPLGFVLAVFVAVVCTHWPLAFGIPRPLEIAYLAAFRPLFGVSVACIVLLSLSEHPLGRALARVLSARVLYPFAQLAYSIYLLNPIMTNIVHGHLTPRLHGSAILGVRPYFYFAPCDAALTVAAAVLLYLLVERPFMELRPSSRRRPAAAH